MLKNFVLKTSETDPVALGNMLLLNFSDVVLDRPRPPSDCSIMHVCVYICVFIATPYMYTYTEQYM